MKIKNYKLLHYINLTLEIIPVVLFFVGSLYNIYLATALLMVGSIVGIYIYYLLNKKIAFLSLALAFLALVFGALTLIFHNDAIIKIKVTVLDLLLAIVFFSAAFWKKSIIQPINLKIAKRPSVFVVINNSWGVFFVCVAILNELVWRNYPTEEWVYFKVFGIASLVIIFALVQTVLLLLYTLIRKNRIEKKRENLAN